MKFSRELLVSVVILIAAGLLLRSVSQGEEVPLRKSLADFPLRIDQWSGTEEGLETKILNVLRVDDYMMRQYRDGQGPPLGLYVGYYKSQRGGIAYHSPKNCLPGAGWAFVKTGKTRLGVADHHGQAVEVNAVVIQKGLDTQVMLYWYQDRGRIITSEYWAKMYLVLDAMLKHRTDGAFVRIAVLFTGDHAETALQRGKAFAERIFPLLQEHLPS